MAFLVTYILSSLPFLFINREDQAEQLWKEGRREGGRGRQEERKSKEGGTLAHFKKVPFLKLRIMKIKSKWASLLFFKSEGSTIIV